MLNRNRRLAAIVGAGLAAGAMAVGVSACGNDSSSASATSTMASTMAADSGTPAADLRVTLDRLLSEHAGLAIAAMQKGVSGQRDFEATAAALDRNTDDLGDAIGSVYGMDAQTAFERMWREHIGFFVDYTVATAKGDQAGRKAALAKLANYRGQFAAFLATANPNLTADGVSGLLQQHVMQLTTALDEYHAGRYAKAYAAVREAHAHMFTTGDALAAAIVKQYPEKFATK